MRDLHTLQTHFQDFLLRHDSDIKSEIIDMNNVSAETRLEIYREGYALRLLEALRNDYPVLSKLMGDDRFDLLGRDYIQAHPSHFRSIRWFGSTLADFMHLKTLFTELPWLIEMTHFEWLLTEAFDAADSHEMTLDEMGLIPFESWPEMRFSLHPSLRKIHLSWNTVPMWNAIKDENECPEPQKSDAPVCWIIWRKNYDMHFCSLTADEAFVIDAMLAGENFSAICEGLCEWIQENEVAMHAALILKRFILDSLVSEIII